MVGGPRMKHCAYIRHISFRDGASIDREVDFLGKSGSGWEVV